MKLPVGFPAFGFTDRVPAQVLATVEAEFPPPADPRWFRFDAEHERSKQQGGPECWGPATTRLIVDLLAPKTCEWVAGLIGVPILVGDVVGGGMHQSTPGAYLDVHVDFDRHPDTGWRRAANLLLYLNDGWQEEWGGCLELHGDGDPFVVVPSMGRMVVFECSDQSWHGHPVPVVEGRNRRSIAVYYYDPFDRPVGRGHSTTWKG